MKKVLYITYDGLTDPLGQSQILPYLQHLTLYGYQFTILSFEKKNRLQHEGAIVQSVADRSNIRWVPLTFTSSPPILSKMYDRYRMWQIAKALHREIGFDLIHCRSYIAAEMGLRLKKLFGVKMLFDMRGFWADEKVDNGQWNQQRLLYRKIYRHYKKKEKEFLLNADGIVSLTQAAKNYLLQNREYQHLSIEVIPCCADLQHFNFATISSANVTGLRASLGIPPSAKVISYLGSIGGWYMIKEMFGFFKILHQQYPEYVMLILTKDDPGQVQREALQAGVPSEKIFVTYSERRRLPVFLALSDWSIFFIRNTFSKTASSPTKHAEIMGMGVPVICNNIGDTGRIIEESQTGLVVHKFNEEEYKRIIGQLHQEKIRDREHIRKSAFHYFDLSTGVAQYLRLYQQIFN